MDVIEKINARYIELFEKLNPIQQIESFNRKVDKCKLQLEGKRFPTFLKPHFLRKDQRKYLQKVTRHIVSAIEKVTRAYGQNEAIRDFLNSIDEVQEYLEIKTYFDRAHPVVRLDTLFNPQTNELKIIEFNTDSPNGIGWHDKARDIYLQNETIKELKKEYNLEVDKLTDPLAQTFIGNYKQYCHAQGKKPQDNPYMALSCIKSSHCRNDLAAIADVLNIKGYRCKFADPRDLDYANGKLFHDNNEVHLIYRDALQDFVRTHKPIQMGLQSKLKFHILRASDVMSRKNRFINQVIKRTKIGHPLDVLEGFRQGAVCLINPLKAYVGHPKALAALMHEDAFNYLFDADELEVIKECIPWTAVIEDKRIQRNGVTVKLKDYLVENKDSLVIKPDMGFGGKMCYIGNITESSQWEQIIDHAIPISGPKRFVVQEMAGITKDKFPILENNDYKGFEEYNVLINLWSFDGEFGGAHVRAAKTEIINISRKSRGGLVPVFYIDI